jgi:DNA repair exonuclease SbcCD ATPase subunit
VITFKKIRFKNFLSTGNFFTEIDLNKTSSTLIVGENGAGKSTILDALSFVLFSKPFRKINKPQLVNSITRKDTVVEIEFSIGDDEYKIVRGLRPNLFEVYKNDFMLNQSAEMRDYQEILEKNILKVNHKSFCQVVILGSATFQPFMQLPTGQRREIIEDLLDLQIFTTMNNLLKERVNKNRDDVLQNTSDKRLVEEKIKLVKEHMAEVQKNSDKLVAEKRERVTATDIELDKFISSGKQLELDIVEYKSKISDEDAVSKRTNKLNTLKHQLMANIGALKNDIEFLNNHENCPTCHQIIQQEFKAESVEKKNDNINEVQEGLDKLTEELVKSQERLEEIVAAHAVINEKKMDLHKIKTKVNSLLEYKKQLEEEINSIFEAAEANDNSKLDTLQVELDRVVEDGVKYNEERELLAVASFLLKDGGIKSKIIKQYIPIINRLINKYLSAMDFFVQFELDEEFNETIKSRYRDEFSYASFSEGEKMRINLAVLFTWRSVAKLRNSINTNLLIMDEVFDSSLDSNGTEEFMKIIKSLIGDTNTFIISHKGDQLFDKFESLIKFEKNKNFSRIAS